MPKTTRKPRKPVRTVSGKSGEAVQPDSLAKPVSSAEVDGWEIESSSSWPESGVESSFPAEQPTNEELAKRWDDRPWDPLDRDLPAAVKLALAETQQAHVTQLEAQIEAAKAQAAQKPRRQDHTLGIGEYYDPKHRSYQMGVVFFFRAISCLVPDVFTELEDLMGDELDERVRVDVGPEVIAQPGALTKLEKLFKDPSSQRDLPAWLPNRWANDPRVIKWATRRGMADAHILLTVTTSMDRWTRDRATRRRWTIAEPLPPDLQISILPWNPCCELEQEFDARVKAYKKVVMNAAHARGWKPTRDAMAARRKRTQPGQRIERHFVWLALWVVAGDTLDQIADRYVRNTRSRDQRAPFGRDWLKRSTIWTGIQSAAKLAGVTVHPRQR